MNAMNDPGLCVRMSNGAKRRIGLQLDYVHMPGVMLWLGTAVQNRCTDRRHALRGASGS